jgi:uncharacterized membrane protein
VRKTVVGIFKDENAAERAVRSLRDDGFTDQEISIVAKEEGRNRNRKNEGTTMQGDGVSDGVASGAAWGGLAGLALGAGALAIPGIGPIVAAGPIAAALTGAATGGLAGGLIDWGIPEQRGRELQEQVKQGKILAILQCSENKVNKAANILRENGASNVETHNSRG